MPAAPTAGPFTLNQIAEACGGRVEGNGALLLRQVNTLEHAASDEIAFLANPKYRRQLGDTDAGAVVLAEAHAALTTAARLLTDQPYLTYARIAQLFNPLVSLRPGAAASARIDVTAKIASTAAVGENVIVGGGAQVGEEAVLHPGVVVGAGCRIGARTIVHPNVVLYPFTVIGDDCVIHAGAVLGADGFGMAESAAGWVRIPQIGCVIIGNRVDVGANTTIDRGALDDTVISDDVKLDNQIQIGHNVRIGHGTAIAGCVGIAGSVRIGKNCRIGGAAMISGHIELGDGVTIAGGTVVAKSLLAPGVYAGVYPLDTMDHWRRTAVRVRRIDELATRLETMEKILRAQTASLPQPRRDGNGERGA